MAMILIPLPMIVCCQMRTEYIYTEEGKRCNLDVHPSKFIVLADARPVLRAPSHGRSRAMPREKR
jgi:hypothetical protein